MKRTNEHQTIVTHAYVYSVIDDMLNKFQPQKQSYLEPSGSGSYLECGSQIRNSFYVS